MMKKTVQMLLVVLLLGGQVYGVQAVTTTPTVLPYEGILKDSAGSAIVTAQDFRFSIWSDSDYDAPADFDLDGDIPGGAPGFSGYEEVQTITPDSTGFFQLNIGSVTPIPDFITTDHTHLQVEIKPNGSPNTSYEILDTDGIANATDRQPFGTVPYASNADFLDNAEIGTGDGNLVILGAGDVFPLSVIPGGSNAETFELDNDGTGGVIRFSFGDTLLNRILSFDPDGVALADGWFNFSDDVNVAGDVFVSGTLQTASGITVTGGAANFSAVTQFRIRESNFAVDPDCTDVGELVFDTSVAKVKYCTAPGSPGVWLPVDSSAQDLDGVYGADLDKTLAVNDVAGLTLNASTAGNILFNLQSTGDFVIQDNGTAFALFSDTGLFELSGLENTERLRLTDTTNADSVGLYVGTGTPDGIISAQAGSAYFDELGGLYINTSSGSGTTWNKHELSKQQTVTVAKSGGDFTSVKAAVESITDATTSKRYQVLIYPGTYVEDTITMPDYVSLEGAGSFENVVIQANDPAATLIIGGQFSIVRNLELEDANGVGGICFSTTKESYIIDIELESCETGILASGASSTMTIVNLTVESGDFTDVVRIQSGAGSNTNGFRIPTSGSISKVFNITGAGTRVQVNNAAILSANITDIIYVNDSALVSVLNSNFQNSTYGIHVGPAGASTVRGSGGIVENMSTNTFLVEPASAMVYYNSVTTQKEKFNVHPSALFSITFSNNTSGEEGFNVFGKASFGTPENPDDLYVGEGSSYTNGMLVYTFDGTTYTDVSDEAANPVGTPFTFPGVSAGNAIYISTDRKDPDLNYLQFGGFRYTTTSTVANFGVGAVTHEYWNGSAWTSFTIFCYHNDLYYRYTTNCYKRPDSKEHNNFETFRDNWIANDPASLGQDRFWIRIRISSPLIIAPEFEMFKIQANSMEITENGSLVFFGAARGKQQIVSSPYQIFTSETTNSPADASYRVGSVSTATVNVSRSVFRGSGINMDELDGTFTLPKGIDTSVPLDVRIFWKKTSDVAGTVQWKLSYGHITARNNLVTDGTNIATTPKAEGDDHGHGAATIETTPTESTNISETILLDFSPALNIARHYEGDVVYVKLFRDAADPDDTYTGDVIMTGFEIYGTFWNLSPKS